MARPAKQAWSKPELVVLVRGKPEEAVLSSCKGDGPPTSSGQGWGMCAVNCGNCQLIGTS